MHSDCGREAPRRCFSGRGRTMRRYVVEKQKILRNIGTIRQAAQDAAVYAVVKADGYGLGCAALAKLCAEGGLRRFCVTDPAEAEALAGAGVPFDELLLLTPVSDPDTIAALDGLGVTFTAASEEDVQALAAQSRRTGRRTKAHLAVDTGMGRRGFPAQDRDTIAQIYLNYPEVAFTGVFSHLACGYDRRASQRQYTAFLAVLEELTHRGIEPGTRHLCASAGLFYQPQLRLDAVRVGSAMLGRIVNGQRFDLERTGVCQTAVEQVRDVPKGTRVGYCCSYVTRKPRTLATVPLGTHFGFGVERSSGSASAFAILRCALRRVKKLLNSNKRLCVMIGGRFCPVVGAVGSEAMVVDVTDVECRRGDTVLAEINPLHLSHMQVEFVD